MFRHFSCCLGVGPLPLEMQVQPLRRRDVLMGLSALGLTSTVASAASAAARFPLRM